MRELHFVGWLLIGFLSLPGVILAQEAKNEAEDKSSTEQGVDEELGLVDRAVNYVDNAQRIASERFGRFMTQVDGFFSDAEANEEVLSNDSWARLRLDLVKGPGKSMEFDPSLKVRAELPNTEQKLKLLIETDERDSGIDVDNARQRKEDPTSANQNASVALRFIRSARTNGNLNLDVGVRQRAGSLQIFGRVNMGYRKTLAEVWDFKVSNSYWYYSKSGFEDRLSLDFRRALFEREDLFFRSYTEFSWKKEQLGAIIGQTVGIYEQFDEARALAFEALAGYHTALNEGIEDHYRGLEIRLRWRHNIWRPWFFYEVWPSVSWPSTVEYEKSYGLLLRAEILFGQR